MRIAGMRTNRIRRLFLDKRVKLNISIRCVYWVKRPGLKRESRADSHLTLIKSILFSVFVFENRHRSCRRERANASKSGTETTDQLERIDLSETADDVRIRVVLVGVLGEGEKEKRRELASLSLAGASF